MGFRRSVPIIYAGGFLGPFMASLTGSILPELGDAFSISGEQAAQAVTAYLVPFASLMLVSGAVGRRLGVTRIATIAYAFLVVTALGSAFAASWSQFLILQALSGALNAFTTPLLMAMLKSATSPDRLGRALGLFASLQSFGLLCGPLLSGLSATYSWRVVYGAVAVLSVGIVLSGFPSILPKREPWRELFGYFTNRWIYVLAGTVALVGLCVNGLVSVVVLYSVDLWDLNSVNRGLLVMSGGVAAMLVSTPVGRLLDRHGPARVTFWSMIIAIIALLPAPFMPQVWQFVIWWFLASAAVQAAIVGLMTTLMLRPGAGSAISVFQGARFGGLALGPILFIPLYQHSIVMVFGAAALGLVVALTLLFLVFDRSPAPRTESILVPGNSDEPEYSG